MNLRREKIIVLILGLLAIGFGAMTIKSGGFALALAPISVDTSVVN